MSIQTQIDRLESNVANTYSVLEGKGAVMPAARNSDNLAATAATISSGGGELNFEVVGGTSRPTNPKGNTIWVNTSTAITGYTFSKTQPTGSAGLVWFQADSGNLSFNALKENSIMLYPCACKQYIGSAWTSVNSYIYQSGWKDIRLNLYVAGNTFDMATGGFTAKGLAYSSSFTSTAPSVTYNASDMQMTLTYRYKSGIVHTTNKVNLSAIKTLQVKGTALTGQDSQVHISVWSDVSSFSGGRVANLQFAANNVTHTLNHSIDVSGLTGSYYVGFGLMSGYGGSAILTVTDLYGVG